ncbi:MAG TPA: class I SAM-dependent methyltransferase [Candidatus Limnocylindrales bacterium]|nr:class I SAM-dependent methyltransferase [Candidatus Limnocylindrales bacterium]
MARWWAEFERARPEEVAYYAAAIRRFGQPALDLGCGAGRLLVPLLDDGFDVDGVDIAPDMLAHAAAAAREGDHAPVLTVQALHQLDLKRTYRTAYGSGVFGIGVARSDDREALRRIHRHLEPGGALLLEHELPYAGRDEASWARWLAGRRQGIPRDWRARGDRRRAADGDEIELITRLASFDPLEQVQRFEIRARLWHAGEVVREEDDQLTENLYFAQELLLLLEQTGFGPVSVEGPHTGRPAEPDDGTVIFVARA